ncbi:ImmA/IrrE family metallo-endopeptidase [Oceanicola sp. 22II-s10i]|uniref:ImmA/IrrE family metallo-endopeptidase n=1 Tax=Oceanicola sp. 22II-s10i TaxID=1317116 RepID=UPI000B5214C0|nr:ImmA/IrrE family metallo-endopeptidase [Oceanicola sp. 22II-s10i]
MNTSQLEEGKVVKTSSKGFREELAALGISSPAISAVWPNWWSDDAESSKSAQAELRFTVARRLGLSPKSVIGEAQPEFVWKHEAKFKGLSNYGGGEQAALTSFGVALTRHLRKGVLYQNDQVPDASTLRRAILKNAPFVRLQDLCAASWGLGIPVIHLRVFPLAAKHMVAMAVRVESGHAILIGKDAKFPAPTAFHVAHELGHIASSHLVDGNAIVDLEEVLTADEDDAEEREADEFALELLTGQSTPKLEYNEPPRNGLELASAALRTSNERAIEPGTIALCYGHQTGNWRVANAALSHIYEKKGDVWRFLNLVAQRELNWSAYQDDEAAYLKAILGAPKVG